MNKKEGYILIILMVAVFIMAIGFLLAAPIWKTQIQREKEEELIFRGKQYVEAVRLFQIKYPGSFAKTFEELLEERCLRKMYKDPMTENGEWNIILPYGGASRRREGATQRILVVPQSALGSVDNPRIIGVVSSSPDKSIKIYFDQETYDKWLFYYGFDPEKMPEIIYYGETEKR
jgi:type II secretory pathway pseudopilin PulG